MTPWFFSEFIDYLKILGNPWINWFLNFPYDITTVHCTEDKVFLFAYLDFFFAQKIKE